MAEELFTTRMKRATRKVHAVSDSLVNVKLIFALNNDNVWAEGLLIFYEIFKFLETAMREKKDENLGQLYMVEMNRTDAFESDLSFYLGPDWKNDYEIRESVINYLKHLKKLLQTDSDLLMAYVYHLYMGLLSGGQILRKKRQFPFEVFSVEERTVGEAVTDFGDEEISDLKSRLKDRMNAIAENLDENKKALLVQESIKVFELNNSIIRTVQGSEKVAYRNVIIFFSSILVLLGVLFYYVRLLIKNL